MMPRQDANAEWDTNPKPGAMKSWEMVQIDVLMDIRSCLWRTNSVLQIVSDRLVGIQRNTAKPRKRKKKVELWESASAPKSPKKRKKAKS
jgi:hypothetical protein